MDVLHVDPFVLPGLVVLGLATGFLTGLFGIGGAFITTPVMIAVLGIDPSLAVGSSMGLTLVNGLVGLRGHAGMGHVETRAIWAIGIPACCGTLAGFQLHHYVQERMGHAFSDFVSLAYVVTLLPIALLVWWQSDRKIGRPWLSRLHLPPMIRLKQKELPPVSLTVLALFAVLLGIAKGLVGIGGGIILLPFLVLVVGLTPQRAVAVSLGMVTLTSVVGTGLYAWSGDFSATIVVAMLAGSVMGIGLGTRMCHVSTPKRLKRLLALLIFAFVIFLTVDLIL
jgi:uncharacterized membrane protein YfcA